MQGSFFNDLTARVHNGDKAFVLLIDPDEYSEEQLTKTLQLASRAGVDYLFLGGSLLVHDHLSRNINQVREHTDLHCVLFPGSPLQFHPEADAMLFLSLISGRNPDMLIGRHIEVAPLIKQSNVEPVPTGYMLIDGGRPTSVSYVSNTQPIPSDKPDIAASTAMAGEMLGLQCIYMDAGSGAKEPVSPRMIEKVKESISAPLIVGGGMKTKEDITNAAKAGGDVVVVGNAIQDGLDQLPALVESFHSLSKSRHEAS